ncbi:MAG: PepSY domain-containing protein [Thermoplasmataceae archaeon]
MLSTIASAKAILAVLGVLSTAFVVGTAGGSIGHALSGIAGSPGTANANLSAAEQAAVNYVSTHYSGNGTAKILKVENDTEKGVAVFDINILAPNGSVYVVHVSRATDQVLGAHLAENQNTTNTRQDNQDSKDTQSNADDQSNDSSNTNTTIDN